MGLAGCAESGKGWVRVHAPITTVPTRQIPTDPPIRPEVSKCVGGQMGRTGHSIPGVLGQLGKVREFAPFIKEGC